MWGVVRNLVDDGSTILLTTQYLEEADALADEITVIDHGRVIAHDTPTGLKRIVGGQTLTVRPSDPSRLEETANIIAEIGTSLPVFPARGTVAVPVTGDEALSERRRPPERRRHRRHRALAAPAQPRRGLLLADLQAQGGARMTRLVRHSTALAKRNLIGVTRNPERCST